MEIINTIGYSRGDTWLDYARRCIVIILPKSCVAVLAEKVNCQHSHANILFSISDKSGQVVIAKPLLDNLDFIQGIAEHNNCLAVLWEWGDEDEPHIPKGGPRFLQLKNLGIPPGNDKLKAIVQMDQDDPCRITALLNSSS